MENKRYFYDVTDKNFGIKILIDDKKVKCYNRILKDWDTSGFTKDELLTELIEIPEHLALLWINFGD